jgi:predicted alpha/beta hydrolase family esterase
MSQSEVFLILHGTGGNATDHWQEHLVDALRAEGKDVRYPELPDASTPLLETWMPALEAELASVDVDARLTVIAHSRGSILWLHYAARSLPLTRLAGHQHYPVRPERVLLVAPPYYADEPVSDWMFFPPPLSAGGIAVASELTAIIASDDDEYASFDEAAEVASTLNVPIYKLPQSGHISPTYGYGPWPWIVDWALHRADFPPVRNRP